MKKIFLFYILIVSSAISADAQLKVFSDGKVGVGANLDSVSAKLSVGDRQYAPATTYLCSPPRRPQAATTSALRVWPVPTRPSPATTMV